MISSMPIYVSSGSNAVHDIFPDNVLIDSTQWYAVVCSGMQWYAVVCSSMQWYAVVCSGMQWYAVVCSGMQWYALSVCSGMQ